MAQERLNSEYARRVNTREFKPIIEACRQGNFDNINNGYRLWCHSTIVIENGGSWHELGSSQEEKEGFLVDDLKRRIAGIKDHTSSTDKAFWDLTIIGAY